MSSVVVLYLVSCFRETEEPVAPEAGAEFPPSPARVQGRYFSFDPERAAEHYLEGFRVIESLETDALEPAFAELRSLRISSELPVLHLVENALVMRWHDEAGRELTSYFQETLDWTQESSLTLPLKLSFLYEASPDSFIDFLTGQPEPYKQTCLQTALTFIPKEDPLHQEVVKRITTRRQPAAASREQAGSGLDSETIRILMQEDPGRAFEELQAYIQQGGAPHSLVPLLREFSKTYPEHAGILALDVSLQYPGVTRALEEVLLEWATIDPGTVLREIQSVSSQRIRKELYRLGYQGWAKTDPAQATHHAYAYIPTSSECHEILPLLLREWMSQDPVAAARFMEALPPNAIDQFDRIYEPWVAEDPEAALNHLLAYSDQQLELKSDQQTLRTVMNIWMEQDLNAATAWALEMEPGQMRDELIQAMLSRYPKNQFEQGLDLLSAVQSPARQIQSLGNLLDQEFGDNALQKIEVLETFQRTPGIEGLLMSQYEQWAQKDVLSVVNHFPTDLGYNFQRTLSTSVALAYYNHDRDASMKWMKEVHPAFQGMVYKQVAKQIAYKEGGPQAAQFLKDMGPVGIGASGYEVIAQQWSRQDPEASMKWAVSLEDPSGRHIAVAESYEAMLQSNPAQAARWIEARKDHPAEYQAMAERTGYHSLRQQDMKAAVEWAMEVEDPGARARLVRHVSRKISDGEKERIRRSLLSTKPLTAEQVKWIEENF